MAYYCLILIYFAGVGVNSATPFGRTPLHAAVAKDHVTIVDMLLNNGASHKQADRYGVVPLILAQQMSSAACFRKLRLMQLNLRGSASSSSTNKSTKSIKIQIQSDTRTENSKNEKINSSKPPYSETNSSPKHNFSAPLHASRKHLSKSAPLNETSRKVPEARDGTYSSLSNATTGKIRRSKGNVKWKDTKTEYVYWKNLGTHTKTPREVEDTVNVKSMSLAEPKAIIKYSNIAKQNIQKAENGDDEISKDSEELAKAMQYSKDR